MYAIREEKAKLYHFPVLYMVNNESKIDTQQRMSKTSAIFVGWKEPSQVTQK